MKITKKVLAGILILILINISVSHVLADGDYSYLNPGNSEHQEFGHYATEVVERGMGCCDVGIYGLGLGCCDTKEYELELVEANIYEMDIENLDLEDYERVDLFFIASPILHAPDEQLIAVFFGEEIVLREAILNTRSLVTGEEFLHFHYEIIENTVSFVICHPEGSGEDEIFLVSIEYNFEGREEAVTLLFSEHNIETSYRVTNEPMLGSEESGIVIHGIAEDGEVITEIAQLENISERIEEILYVIDDEATPIESVEPMVEEMNLTIETPSMLNRAVEASSFPGRVVPPSHDRIIVISAGHCATHVGAFGNGLAEHELNWHVAGVIVDELNTFPGITAIRDRETIGCRWPGGGWQRCVVERVHQASRDGAGIFVDIHFNASTNPAAHGAEIWIANTSRNDGMHQAGRILSDEILRRLSELGMHNRGHRMHAVGDLEFASVRISRELGMVGILFEGGFLTNTGDANRLRDYNFRHQMGLEVARGIAAMVGPPLPDHLVPLWRMFNGDLNQHLWTTCVNEYRILSTRGWRQEGIAWYTPRTGRPVHRLFHEGIARHHYTADQDEISVLVQRGWNDEGVLFFCASPLLGEDEGIRMIRLFHEDYLKHLHTADIHEVRVLTVHRGWRKEGESFVGLPVEE